MITPFEGKRVEVQLFRIASFPQIQEGRSVPPPQQHRGGTQDMTARPSCARRTRLRRCWRRAAVSQYRVVDARRLGPRRRCAPNEITIAGTHLMPDDLYTAVTTDQRQLDSRGCWPTPGVPAICIGGDQHHRLGLQGPCRPVSGSCSSVSSRSARASSSRAARCTRRLSRSFWRFSRMYFLDVEENNQALPSSIMG